MNTRGKQALASGDIDYDFLSNNDKIYSSNPGMMGFLKQQPFNLAEILSFIPQKLNSPLNYGNEIYQRAIQPRQLNIQPTGWSVVRPQEKQLSMNDMYTQFLKKLYNK